MTTHKHPTIVERTGPALIEMKDISIAIGGIKAVDHASVDLYPGEVVGLLGHNGAGKSTLIKILSGAYKRDHGDIFISGSKVEINNPRDAKALGIETIYQTLALADNVDAAANLYLGRELRTRWPMTRGFDFFMVTAKTTARKWAWAVASSSAPRVIS